MLTDFSIGHGRTGETLRTLAAEAIEELEAEVADLKSRPAEATYQRLGKLEAIADAATRLFAPPCNNRHRGLLPVHDK